MASAASGERQDQFDDFAQFSKGDDQPQNGHNGYDEDHIEEVYDEEEEDEIDYEPQNGYHLDDVEYPAEEEEVQVEAKPGKKEKPKKEKKPREPMKMPTINIKGKLDAMNNSIKNFTMPSPADAAESIGTSLKMPLAVRVRTENEEVQRQRAELVKNRTVSELASMRHPLDIPLPKLRSRNKSTDGRNKEEKEEKQEEENPTPEKSDLYNTLPRSWRTQNLVTSTREMEDPEELAARKALIETKTPAQLAEFHGLGDIPVPTGVKNLFAKKERTTKDELDRADDEAPFEPFNLYGTLSKSMKETKLLTNTREVTDPEELRIRQELIRSKSPTELAEIKGLGDIPVPTKIQNIFKARSRSSSVSKQGKEPRSRSESLPRSVSGLYGTLPRSWREQKLVTKVKVEEDEEKLATRKALTETKTPAELAQMTSIADLPIPSALQNFLKSEKKAKDDAGPSGPKFDFDNMYNNIPQSLKTEVLVRTKVEEDPEELARRKALTETKTPAELAKITSLGDIPMPATLERMVKSGGPRAPSRKGKAEMEEKRKRNLSIGAIFTYEGLPESLKSELLVRSKTGEDTEVLKERQELVKSKKPSELAQMSGLEDFPLPTRIETLVRPKRNLRSTKDKEMSKKRSLSWSNLTNPSSWNDTIPRSLKTELHVRAKVEDPEKQKQRQEITKQKTVAELAQMSSLSDLPIPSPVQKLMDMKLSPKTPGGDEGEDKPVMDRLYETLPRSMKSEVQVRVRQEDPEVQRQRQELTRAKSPTELAQMTSLSDFPIPANIEKMLIKKTIEISDPDTMPVAPPRRSRREQMYESIPASLKQEVLVRTKVEKDEAVLKQRQELTRAKSPTELAEMRGLSDFPVPTFVQDLGKKLPTAGGGGAEGAEMPTSMKDMYATLPKSLKSELHVRSRHEDPEVQRERAELVKSKSPTELAQMTSLSDFPLPSTIEQYVRPSGARSKEPGPVERKKRFRDKQRSLSAKNLYDSLPRGLKTDLLVKSRVEEPEVQRARAQLVSSKSVSELSQVTSLSDFPVPATIERMVTRVRSSSRGPTSDGATTEGPPKIPALNTDGIYATLPKSLKSELHVRSRVEDPEVQRQRKELIQSKSVSELAQVKSLADFPIPANIEKLIQGGRGASAKQSAADGSEKAESLYPKMEDIYASLPRSLKSQVMVRTKVEEDEEELKRRQNLVQSKSPGELSQIHNFKEIPLPRRIEAWMHQSEQQKPKPASRSLHELRGNIYDTLPKSLKEPTLVRAKVENPDKLRERRELTRAKTPSQLAEINDIHDIPIPFLWQDKSATGTSTKKESSTLPKNPQEVKDMVYNTVFPESMTKPCVVRSRIEDPMTLRERQDLQQRKSIHELSKIRNLNEFPLPFKVPLPDVPLPSAKGILQVIARNPRAKKSNTTSQDFVSYTPASTPACEEPFTDDEMLRFDASTPGGDLQHRDQDFGYEVIDHGAVGSAGGEGGNDVEEDTLADQYRGTPPLRSKKPQRPRSHNIPEQVQLSDDTPPPLPPKRQSPAVASRLSHSGSSQRVPDPDAAAFHSCADDAPSIHSIQGRPLPLAPGNRASGTSDQFHSVASTLDRTLVDSKAGAVAEEDEATLAESIVDSMHSCADTFRTGTDDATLHSCADTLEGDPDNDSLRDFESPTPPASVGSNK